MEPQIHQIYSYMTHRAVGICSATKSDQFRALSEMTVNRLMEALQDQIAAMQEASKQQKQSNELELEQLQKFQENSEKIKESLAQSLETLKLSGELIKGSFNSLQNELDLRQKSENKLNTINRLSEGISTRLVEQSVDLHEGHQRILKEVEEIAANLQIQNRQLMQQYSETLEFMANFKSVILVLSTTANTMKGYVDSFQATLRDAGLNFSEGFIAFIFINLAYFTSGMVFLLFLNVKDTFCKFLLVALFIFNNVAAYKQTDADLLPINVFAWLMYLCE